jgi:hypothetical protein
MAKATEKATEAEVIVAAAPETVFGVADIAEIIKVKFGKDVKTRDLRTLLRKMARDGRLNREIVAGNRERWVWSGPQDPEVEQILEAYENGELEADKKEKLDALKQRKAEQRAAKKAAEEPASSDDEELEDVEA